MHPERPVHASRRRDSVPHHRRPGPAHRPRAGDAADVGVPARLPATAAPRQRAPALRRARRRARRPGARRRDSRHAARGGHRRGRTRGRRRRTPPGAPSVYADDAPPAPAPAAAAAEEVHAARAVVGDRGRVLLPGRAADDLRRASRRSTTTAPPRSAGPSWPGSPGPRWCSPTSRHEPDPVDRTTDGGAARGRADAARVGGGLRRPGLPGDADRVGAAGTVDGPRPAAALRGDLDRRAAAPCATPPAPAPRSPSSSATPRRRHCSTSWPTTRPAAGRAAAGSLAAEPGGGLRRPGPLKPRRELSPRAVQAARYDSGVTVTRAEQVSSDRQSRLPPRRG